jgi:hypothetical protein
MSILFLSHSLFPAIFTIENHLNEEIAVIMVTDKLLGRSNITVELGQGEVFGQANIGASDIKSIMVLIGSLRTGRVAYDLSPPVGIKSSVLSYLPLNEAVIAFYKDRDGNMRYTFKISSNVSSGLLIKH